MRAVNSQTNSANGDELEGLGLLLGFPYGSVRSEFPDGHQNLPRQ
jgi:hypothetical protein